MSENALHTTSSFMKAGVQTRMTLGAVHHLLLSSQPFLNPRLHEAASSL